MDTIQAAIVTSSLINLPHSEEEPGQEPPRPTATPTLSRSSGVSLSRFFSLGQGSWESFQPWDWCHSEDAASIWDGCFPLEYPHRRWRDHPDWLQSQVKAWDWDLINMVPM